MQQWPLYRTCPVNVCLVGATKISIINDFWWMRRPCGWILHECAGLFSLACGLWKYKCTHAVSSHIAFPPIKLVHKHFLIYSRNHSQNFGYSQHTSNWSALVSLSSFSKNIHLKNSCLYFYVLSMSTAAFNFGKPYLEVKWRQSRQYAFFQLL